MNKTKIELWQRFKEFSVDCPTLGLSLDISRMNFADEFFSSMQPRLDHALAAMDTLEKGTIANPDEKRRVGHYWLRKPELAPEPGIGREIRETLEKIKRFASDVHQGVIRGTAGSFQNVLLIGIGGSALGPQFVANALGHPRTDKMAMYFFDNTDPDGIDRVLAQLEGKLGRTLCVVISKSGGTKETRNGMLEAENAYKSASLEFSKHTVAITSQGSELDKTAVSNGWLERFPMWDWVGGRTSELSAVGLLPAALQGLDIDGLLTGARDCDEITRDHEVRKNPAAQLAAMWFYAGNGKGDKNMIIIPYKDRLELFSKYLQQLVMESLGKEKDLDGQRVRQGLTVLGNKGSTDQHAYVQQLREGRNDFFVTFIEVLRDRTGRSGLVEPHVTSGDYLNGFFQGTRTAIYDNGRESITITVDEVAPRTVGALIALFERSVGLYASLININAYHQPGVEAGKKAASVVIDVQLRLLGFLNANRGKTFEVEELARAIGLPDDVETVFRICRHLAANPDRGLKVSGATTPFQTRFGL